MCDAWYQPSAPPTGTSGLSDYGTLGYGGPCPPVGDGPHHYHVTVSALDTVLTGMPANATGAFITFKSPWTPLFHNGSWRVSLGILCGVSAAAAVVIYAISEIAHRSGSLPAEEEKLPDHIHLA